MFIAIGALSPRGRARVVGRRHLPRPRPGRGVGFDVLDVAPLDPLQGSRVAERISELAILLAVFTAGLSIERVVSVRQWRAVAMLLVVVMPLTIAAIALFASAGDGAVASAPPSCSARSSPPPTPCSPATSASARPASTRTRATRSSACTPRRASTTASPRPFVLAGILIATEGGTGWIGEWVLTDVLYAIARRHRHRRRRRATGSPAATVRLRDRNLLSARLRRVRRARRRARDLRRRRGARRLRLPRRLLGGLQLPPLRVRPRGQPARARRRRRVREAPRARGDPRPRLARHARRPRRAGRRGLAARAAAASSSSAPGSSCRCRPGSLLGWGQRFFLAWFGVRGIAAIFYAAYIAHSRRALAGRDRDRLLDDASPS